MIELVVRASESVERLTQRAAEQGRTDDTADVIRTASTIYERETAPILDVYRERGIVVDRSTASAPLDEITDRIIAALASAAAAWSVRAAA